MLVLTYDLTNLHKLAHICIKNKILIVSDGETRYKDLIGIGSLDI